MNEQRKGDRRGERWELGAVLGRPPGGRLSGENPGWWLETGRGVTRGEAGTGGARGGALGPWCLLADGERASSTECRVGGKGHEWIPAPPPAPHIW